MALPFHDMTSEEVARIAVFPRASVLFVTVLLFVGDEIVLFELDPQTHGHGWSPPRGAFDVSADPMSRARACVMLDTGLQPPEGSLKFSHARTVLTEHGERATHEYYVLRWPAGMSQPSITLGRGSISYQRFRAGNLPLLLQSEEERELILTAFRWRS